jgi:hypothetical protein
MAIGRKNGACPNHGRPHRGLLAIANEVIAWGCPLLRMSLLL